MKLLIIGGSGFVSGHVLTAALEAGHTVWYVTRGLRQPIPGATPIIADRDDPRPPCSEIEGVGLKLLVSTPGEKALVLTEFAPFQIPLCPPFPSPHIKKSDP